MKIIAGTVASSSEQPSDAKMFINKADIISSSEYIMDTFAIVIIKENNNISLNSLKYLEQDDIKIAKKKWSLKRCNIVPKTDLQENIEAFLNSYDNFSKLGIEQSFYINAIALIGQLLVLASSSRMSNSPIAVKLLKNIDDEYINIYLDLFSKINLIADKDDYKLRQMKAVLDGINETIPSIYSKLSKLSNVNELLNLEVAPPNSDW